MIAGLAALGLDAPRLVSRFGLLGVAVIVFAETGLLIGFFLPGDSLLFATGLLIATGTVKVSIVAAVATIIVAAIIGDQTGYQLGRRVGPSMFSRPRSRLFNPANATRAQLFFDRYGPRTIVFARFVPIVRTFAPVVAGIADMSAVTFTSFNVVGAALWGGGVTLAGWSLGRRFPTLGQRIDLLSVVIVAFSLIPVALELRRSRAGGSK